MFTSINEKLELFIQLTAIVQGLQTLDKVSTIQYQYITEHTYESPAAKETFEHPKNVDLSG